MEKRITGRTGMFCLIGTPVGHSGSPAMYNYSFAQTGSGLCLSGIRCAAGKNRGGSQCTEGAGL